MNIRGITVNAAVEKKVNVQTEFSRPRQIKSMLYAMWHGGAFLQLLKLCHISWKHIKFNIA